MHALQFTGRWARPRYRDPLNPTILIVEANTALSNRSIVAHGGTIYSQIFRNLFHKHPSGANCPVVFPNESSAQRIVSKLKLHEIDGVVWTGSSLHAYNSTGEVTSQIRLFEKLFEAGVPIFGSCWGLQLMATALGGRVRRNPRGREIGVARDIELTDAGLEHPLFIGKPRRFDALCTHVDDVELLPTGCVMLASNRNSAIQAAALDVEGRSFWGVQYHPEFSLADMAVIFERHAAVLAAEGVFSSTDEAAAMAQAYRSVHDGPATSETEHVVDNMRADVTDRAIHEREITNWLDHRVIPRFVLRRSRS